MEENFVKLKEQDCTTDLRKKYRVVSEPFVKQVGAWDYLKCTVQQRIGTTDEFKKYLAEAKWVQM